MKIFFLIIFVLFIKSLLSQELTPKWYTLKFEQNHFEFDFPVEKKPDTYGKPFLYRSEWNNIYFRFAYHDSTSIKHDTLINNSIIETFAYKMLNV